MYVYKRVLPVSRVYYNTTSHIYYMYTCTCTMIEAHVHVHVFYLFIPYTAENFTIQWDNVHNNAHVDAGTFTFQLTLFRNGKIHFAYREVRVQCLCVCLCVCVFCVCIS